MKKIKVYKVTVKAEFVITMDHEQTSMEKAKQDVKRVVEDYIKNGKDINNLFNEPPHTIYKVEIKKNDRR